MYHIGKTEKEIENIQIYDLCTKTNPCQHCVLLTHTDKTTCKTVLNGNEIVDILTKLDKHIPEHFTNH